MPPKSILSAVSWFPVQWFFASTRIWQDILFQLLFTSMFPLFPLKVFICPVCYSISSKYPEKPQWRPYPFVFSTLLHRPFANSSFLFSLPNSICPVWMLHDLWPPLLEKYSLVAQTPLSYPSQHFLLFLDNALHQPSLSPPPKNYNCYPLVYLFNPN